MGKTLETLASVGKKALLAGTLLFLPGNAKAADTFEYTVQPGNISRTALDPKPKIYLSHKPERIDTQFRSIGSYSELGEEAKKELEQVKGIKSEQENFRYESSKKEPEVNDVRLKFFFPNYDPTVKERKLKIAYSLSPTRTQIRAGRGNTFDHRQVFREDSDSRVIMALPKEVKIEGISQVVRGIHNRDGRKVGFYACPIDNSDLGELLGDVNRLIDKNERPSKNQMNELERTFDNLASFLPEIPEQVTVKTKDVLKNLLLAQKLREQEFLQDLFSNYQIIEVPRHQPTGEDSANPFKYTCTSRESTVYLNLENLKKDATGMVFPHPVFVRELNGAIETINLNGVAFEFPIKVEPVAESSYSK